MKYFLHIGYDGTSYHGWQFQPNVISVQEVLETALTRVLKTKTAVYGCGRTDTGVHASQYIAHIITDKELEFDLKFILNKNLPSDIVIFDVWEMKGKEHARFDAISRTYDYFIHSEKDPVLDAYSSLYDITTLDIESMQKATTLFTKYNDFRLICKQPHLYNNTICNVTHALLIVNKESGRMRFTITANRFLRGMIRLCIYFLLKIGNREMTLEEFEHLFSNKLTVENMAPANPSGLFLSKVEYPYLKVPEHTSICVLLKQGLEY